MNMITLGLKLNIGLFGMIQTTHENLFNSQNIMRNQEWYHFRIIVKCWCSPESNLLP